MKKIDKQLTNLYDKMYGIAILEVERLARKCLSQNPKHFNEFVMCMGTFFFTDKKGEVVWGHIAEKRSGYKPLDDFICEWNSILKLTGEPMRFTSSGKIITHW